MSRVFCRGVIREHIAGKQQHTNRALEVCTAKILADEKSLCRNQFEILMMSSLFPLEDTTKTHPGNALTAGQLVCSDCSTDAAYPERSRGIIILLWRSL